MKLHATVQVSIMTYFIPNPTLLSENLLMMSKSKAHLSAILYL